MNDSENLPWLIEILNQACARLAIDFFMIGRLAIAFQFSGKVGEGQIAKTLDVDFAFMVRGWNEYENLRRHLLERSQRDFSEDARQRQRLIFHRNLIVDLVPVGGVADHAGKAHWPPDGSPVMNVQGFEDAFAEAQWTDIESARVRVASPRGLALLKLIAWNDCQDRTKDIADLAFMMRHYEKIEGADRLYSGADADLLEIDHFDLQLAWARILGRDIGRMIIRPATTRSLQAILQREQSEPFTLAALLENFLQYDFRTALNTIENLAAGLDEGWNQNENRE